MKALIIEDESIAARRLEKMLRELDPELEIVGCLDSIESVFQWWEQHTPPDIIFQDIHLADGSSFEIFNHLNIQQPIIFITAYDQYAIQAFKVNAVDYLLKPIKRKELAQALSKYKKNQEPGLDYSRLAEMMKKDSYDKRFLIRFGQQIRIVEISEVAYFYTENKITFLVTHEGKRYPVDYSLENLEEIVDPRNYFRINRQYIISMQSIDEMYAYSKSRVKIELKPSINDDIIVSTERSPHFKKWLVGEL